MTARDAGGDGHGFVSVRERRGLDTPDDEACAALADDLQDAGCEVEHYDLSVAIGEIIAEQVRDAGGEDLVAVGASCRAQLAEFLGERPRHPMEAADALIG